MIEKSKIERKGSNEQNIIIKENVWRSFNMQNTVFFLDLNSDHKDDELTEFLLLTSLKTPFTFYCT